MNRAEEYDSLRVASDEKQIRQVRALWKPHELCELLRFYKHYKLFTLYSRRIAYAKQNKTNGWMSYFGAVGAHWFGHRPSYQVTCPEEAHAHLTGNLKAPLASSLNCP